VIGGIALRDVVQFVLLVNINKNGAVKGVEQSGAPDLLRLEDDVAVGEDDRLTNCFTYSTASSEFGYRRLANG
jgi:hypothetical protein